MGFSLFTLPHSDAHSSEISVRYAWASNIDGFVDRLSFPGKGDELRVVKAIDYCRRWDVLHNLSVPFCHRLSAWQIHDPLYGGTSILATVRSSVDSDRSGDGSLLCVPVSAPGKTLYGMAWFRSAIRTAVL